MKFFLFLILLGAFVLDIVLSSTGGGVIGLSLTNMSILTVTLLLVVSEVLSGRLRSRNMTGVGMAIIVITAVLLSLFYAKVVDIYRGSLIDNFRSAKSYVIVPAILYILSFLLVDTREQGRRYLLLMVTVLGMLNILAIIASHFGVEIFRVYETYAAEDQGQERMAGFTGNPNKTAYLTCILVACQYYFYRFHKARLVRQYDGISPDNRSNSNYPVGLAGRHSGAAGDVYRAGVQDA